MLISLISMNESFNVPSCFGCWLAAAARVSRFQARMTSLLVQNLIFNMVNPVWVTQFTGIGRWRHHAACGLH